MPDRTEAEPIEVSPDPATAKSDAKIEVEEILRTGSGEPVESLPSSAHLATQDYKQDIDLKAVYARWLRWMLIGQLVFADIVFLFMRGLAFIGTCPPQRSTFGLEPLSWRSWE